MNAMHTSILLPKSCISTTGCYTEAGGDVEPEVRPHIYEEALPVDVPAPDPKGKRTAAVAPLDVAPPKKKGANRGIRWT